MSEHASSPEHDEITEHDEMREHDGIPIRGNYGGEPVPDLNRIPRERWREVLAPLSDPTRRQARAAVQSMEDVIAAGILLGELLIADCGARARARDTAPPRMPAGSPPAKGAGRQVNFRLGPDEHARLLQAAKLFGMRPTALARAMTVRGVDRALYDARRDR